MIGPAGFKMNHAAFKLEANFKAGRVYYWALTYIINIYMYVCRAKSTCNKNAHFIPPPHKYELCILQRSAHAYAYVTKYLFAIISLLDFLF